MMVTVLLEGTRKARKHHQCWHCYRSIAPGATYGFQNNVCDGSAYTLKWHQDCEAMATEMRKISGHVYDWEGFQPLRDEMCESGEYQSDCNGWRGFYPHVVARMELTDQLREARK